MKKYYPYKSIDRPEKSFISLLMITKKYILALLDTKTLPHIRTKHENNDT